MSTTLTRTTRYLPDVDVSRPIPAELVLPPLSPMQSLVARGVADGLTNAEIAERLCISHDTVKNHVTNIGIVLGLRRHVKTGLRVQIARWLWERAS